MEAQIILRASVGTSSSTACYDTSTTHIAADLSAARRGFIFGAMNSRWTTKPVTRGGELVSIRPNVPGDIEILKCLGRYTVLTAQDIAALTRRSYGAVIARLSLLKRVPHKMIAVHRTQLDSPRLYQSCAQAFHLTPRGISKLNEIGFEPLLRDSSSHFLHTLTESQLMASFEIGARERLVAFSEIRQSPCTPNGIKESGDHSLPIAFAHRGKQCDYRLTPDGRPFAIEYLNGHYRFFVLEVDLRTEQLKWSDKDRQTIERKLIAYRNVLESGVYRTHLGFPNLTVLFTTTTMARLESMRELLASIGGHHLDRFAFSVLSKGRTAPERIATARPVIFIGRGRCVAARLRQ